MSLIFSAAVKEIISYSFEEASRLGNSTIRPEHLLLGIIRSKNNSACRLMERMHIDVEGLKKDVESSIQQNKEPRRSFGFFRSLHLAKEAESVITGAKIEARSLHTEEVDADHLMLSILKDDAFASQIIAHIRHN
jgi:ATP-dependent Clp protease ATP-binding subunit ClpC